MDDSLRVREAVMKEMVEHLVRTGANVATPDDPLAKLRRGILRGLRD